MRGRGSSVIEGVAAIEPVCDSVADDDDVVAVAGPASANKDDAAPVRADD